MKWITKILVILALAFGVTAGRDMITPDTVYSAQDGFKANLGKLAAIKSINVTGDGDATELVIKLTSPATFTSYKTSAPLRLVLDLSQALEGFVTTPLIINKGNFKTITVNRFDTDAGILTRVDIEILKDAEAVIRSSPTDPGELRVSFPSLVATHIDSLNNDSSTKTIMKPEVPLQAVPDTKPLVDQTAIKSEGKLRKLTAVLVENGSIVLKIDGGVSEFNSFRLNKPERFVIDLFDTQLAISSRIIPLNTAGVASARIGLYPDKIRIVLDAVNERFPDVTVAKSDQGLSVALSTMTLENPNTKLVATKVEPPSVVSANAKNERTAVAPVVAVNVERPVAVPAPPPVTPVKSSSIKSEAVLPARVEMIDFQVIENISRVSIKVVGEVVVDPPVKSPGFVTLTIKKAGLSKQLQRSLEAKSFISPVLRITPLLIKTSKGNNTKIRIAMRAAAPYEFRQEGDMLYIDFLNPKGLTAEKVQAEVQDLNQTKASRANTTVSTQETKIKSELLGQSESNRMSESDKTYTGRKISLEFADADVRKIFQLLSEVSGKNFVLGDEVTGNISLKLVNVPWTQALDIIIETKGFEYKDENNIVMIRGAGKLKSAIDAAAEKRQAQLKSGRLVTRNFAINYSNSDDVATALKPLLRYDWQGSLTSDKRTNTVIVNAVEQLMEEIEKLVKVIDVPEKQVMIEARIVEASSTFTRSLGVNWGVHYRDGSASFLGINQLDTSFGGQASTAAPTSGLSGSSGGAMGISFGTLTSNISLDLRLNAAASAGLINIVSTPKVATLNNKTAKITQGQQVPYTSATSDKTETKFVEAALSLEVTPHINSNGTISMKIDAKNDSVGQAAGGSTAPAINKKQATTEMLLRDGETTVIGGIFVDSDNDSDDGVPYLMDIPFLGKLFRSNSRTKVKTELLIFITPRILNSI
ncbi:MAG: type IV pilus secretin PilQ [Desulfuromonadales bacterium]|nr:type IV pilus secretin PilQ [Desulfuromonadales bacterium]